MVEFATNWSKFDHDEVQINLHRQKNNIFNEKTSTHDPVIGTYKIFIVDIQHKMTFKLSNLVDFNKFEAKFNRICSKKSKSSKFDFRISDLKLEISKFVWIRMNSSELTWRPLLNFSGTCSRVHIEWTGITPKMFLCSRFCDFILIFPVLSFVTGF